MWRLDVQRDDVNVTETQERLRTVGYPVKCVQQTEGGFSPHVNLLKTSDGGRADD